MKNDKFKFLESHESLNERLQLKNYVKKLTKEKFVMGLEEWSSGNKEEFVFLTYDLIDTEKYPNTYDPINEFLESIGFETELYGEELTNNCFVAFISPIDLSLLNELGEKLIKFFKKYLPDFRIYMNITSKSQYYIYS